MKTLQIYAGAMIDMGAIFLVFGMVLFVLATMLRGPDDDDFPPEPEIFPPDPNQRLRRPIYEPEITARMKEAAQ